MNRLLALVREGLASARSQPVVSIVTMVMVGGMIATVLLTTGRTVGAERDVLDSIDSAGTRTIVVRAEAGSGLTSDVIERLVPIDGIQWVGAFGPAADVTNSLLPDGSKVPIRLAWGSLSALGLPRAPPSNGMGAWASDIALRRLGMVDGVGAVSSIRGTSYTVMGRMAVPDYLAFLEPAVIVPQDPEHDGEVGVLVVIAQRPDLVAPLARTVQSLLAVDDPTSVTVTTSEELATLRALIQGQLGAFGRGLVLVVFGIAALLVCVLLFGLVLMRRKDFGRRRALGASQLLIVQLLLLQTTVLSAAGVAVGTLTALAGLAISGDPLPDAGFVVACGVLAMGVCLAAGVLPALAAARRDPLVELRVP